MKRWTVLVVLALAGSTVAGARAADGPVATLGVGDAALWEGDVRPAIVASGRSTRSYVVGVSGGGVLRVAVDRRGGESLELVSPTGRRYPYQASGYAFNGLEIFVDEPEPGNWTARVAYSGEYVPFRLRAKLEAAPVEPGPPVQTLPNLRMVPPHEFTFTPPLGSFGGPTPNCSPQEVVEEGARGCLRLSLGPANEGSGPLMIRFEPLEGVVTSGTAYQRVYLSDGSFTERPAGTYEYHKTHMHYHHSGFGKLELFRVTDPETGELTKVGNGPKQGFCTGDVLMFDWDGFSQPREPLGSGCVNEYFTFGVVRPIGTTMALNTGWADLYGWSQDGMYVEWPDAAPDGLYVVRAEADSKGWVLESNENDNISFALIRVTGDQIDVLERGLGSDPWDANKEPVDDRLPEVW